jgi:hypothetical protein
MPKDMSYVNAILVSTNWNKNDDVFTPDEVYKSVYTPVFKPANENHIGREEVGNKIVGFIKDSYPVDDEYEYYSYDNKDPESFHILCQIGLWQAYFPEAVGSILKSIDENKKYVSMECFFDDFGYALKTEGSDECNLLPRNEITSWLTPYLRAYGGKGKVVINDVEYIIGRWLKDITFSGVGFVDDPANDDSIIFQDYLQPTQASIKYKHIDNDKVETWTKNSKKLKEINNNGVLNLVQGNCDIWPQ